MDKPEEKSEDTTRRAPPGEAQTQKRKPLDKHQPMPNKKLLGSWSPK